MIRRGFAVGLIAGCIALAGCEQKSSSITNGQSEPGAGKGQRGGANDGANAGQTGDSNTAGGKFNNGATSAERPTADPRGPNGGKTN